MSTSTAAAHALKSLVRQQRDRPLDVRDQIALACLSAFLQREPVAGMSADARQHLVRISYTWADTMLAHRDVNPAGACHD